MSILVQNDIEARIRRGELVFTPALDALQLQGHTVDLRLGFTFLVPRQWRLTAKGREARVFDPLEGGHEHFEPIELEPGQYFEVLPGERVLVSALERIAMPRDLSAVLYPRSSVNRQGLEVELTGIIDAGYSGNLIIPVRNSNVSGVVRIYPGQRFCQLEFSTLTHPIVPRPSRYHDKDVIVGALPEEEADEVALIRAGQIEQIKQAYPLKTDVEC